MPAEGKVDLFLAFGTMHRGAALCPRFPAERPRAGSLLKVASLERGNLAFRAPIGVPDSRVPAAVGAAILNPVRPDVNRCFDTGHPPGAGNRRSMGSRGEILSRGLGGHEIESGIDD